MRVEKELLKDLNDEERSAVSNLIASAILGLDLDEVEIRVAASAYLEAIKSMLWARKVYGIVLAKDGIGSMLDPSADLSEGESL